MTSACLLIFGLAGNCASSLMCYPSTEGGYLVKLVNIHACYGSRYWHAVAQPECWISEKGCFIFQENHTWTNIDITFANWLFSVSLSHSEFGYSCVDNSNSGIVLLTHIWRQFNQVTEHLHCRGNVDWRSCKLMFKSFLPP